MAGGVGWALGKWAAQEGWSGSFKGLLGEVMLGC